MRFGADASVSSDLLPVLVIAPGSATVLPFGEGFDDPTGRVRFNAIVCAVDVASAPGVAREIIHLASERLAPGGLLAVPHDLVALAQEFELTVASLSEVDEWVLSCGEAFAASSLVVLRRTDRFTVHDLVHEARLQIDRLTPDMLALLLSGPAPPTVLDTRCSVDRERDGVIAGSRHVPRTVVEWHLDPTNGYLLADRPKTDDLVVVVCSGGYSSSLAAASLRRIGYSRAVDLVGGVHGWRRAGHQLVSPDHSHADPVSALHTPDPSEES
jgi:rhodanese-related sulfurtransferase